MKIWDSPEIAYRMKFYLFPNDLYTYVFQSVHWLYTIEHVYK